MFVDEILDPSAAKDVNNVGPGQHELAFEWIVPRDSALNKTSPQFSFSRSTTVNKDHLGKHFH